MSMKEQVPTNRTSITVAVVILLCAVGFAYSQGWFDWSSPGAEVEMNNVSTSQTLDQEEAKTDAGQVTETVSEPAATPKE